jgi:hypothetical protein
MAAIGCVLFHSGLPNSEARVTFARYIVLAQRAVLRVLHDRQPRRHVQRELPARLAVPGAVLERRFARRGERVGGNSLEAPLILQHYRKCIGRVEHVLREFRRERRQAPRDAREARFARRAAPAAEAKVAQRVIDDAPPCRG